MAFKKSVRVGSFTIGANHPVFIIAEAGVKHNGDIEMAKRLIDEAKAAGADIAPDEDLTNVKPDVRLRDQRRGIGGSNSPREGCAQCGVVILHSTRQRQLPQDESLLPARLARQGEQQRSRPAWL